VLVLLPRSVRTGSDGDDEATDHSSITDDLIVDTGRYVSVCWHEMTYRRVILVPILGSDLDVHTFEHQLVCRQATVSYVQLILAGQSTKLIFFWSQWRMVRDHSQVCQFVDAVWMTNRFIFLRHRVHGHCYPWLAGYPWTIYWCCKQGKYQQCDRDEQCTHFYYGD